MTHENNLLFVLKATGWKTRRGMTEATWEFLTHVHENKKALNSHDYRVENNSGNCHSTSPS